MSVSGQVVYWVNTGASGIIGPIAFETVVDLMRSNSFPPHAMIRRGDSRFVPIDSVKEFAPHLGALRSGVATYTGDVSKRSFFSVFQRLFEGQRTGLLRIRDGTRLRDVYFEEGLVSFVGSNQIKGRLGDYLVERKEIDRGQLQMVVEHQKKEGVRFGDALKVVLGFSEQKIINLLNLQLSERLADLCTWEHARYAFFEDQRYEGELLTVDINLSTLLLSAARKTKEGTILFRLDGQLHRRVSSTGNRLVEQAMIEAQAAERMAFARLDGSQTLAALLTGRGQERLQRRAVLTVLYLLWELSALEFSEP